jgi:hypothetical protein
MWVLLSEIFPTSSVPRRSRLRILQLAGQCQRDFHVPVGAVDLKPAGTFLAFGLMACAALIFTLLFVPETKGRTLEELEHELMSPPSATRGKVTIA